MSKKDLSAKQRDALLTVLKARFEKNTNLHKGVAWAKVEAKLAANPETARPVPDLAWLTRQQPIAGKPGFRDFD